MIVCFVRRSAKIGNHGRKLTSGPNVLARIRVYISFVKKKENTYEIDDVHNEQQENEIVLVFLFYHL
jgi:hypothetical protein